MQFPGIAALMGSPGWGLAVPKETLPHEGPPTPGRADHFARHGPPERDWEGADAEVEPSVRSVADGHVNQLRDPAIYVEGESVYLLYAVAGESGIGIAQLEGFLSPGDGQGGVRTSEKDRGKKNGR